MEEMNAGIGRGGARPGAGRPKADDLDPARRCTYVRPDGSPCGNAASLVPEDAPGFGRCRFHDGGVSRSDKAVAARALAEVSAVIPQAVTVEDFPLVAAEYVAAYNVDFGRRRARLEEIRAEGGDEVEFTREYADILSHQRADAVLVTKLMEAAAKMGISAAAIAEAKVRIGEAHARWAMGVCRTIVRALDLTEEQEVIARDAVLARIAAEEAEGRIATDDTARDYLDLLGIL